MSHRDKVLLVVSEVLNRPVDTLTDDTRLEEDLGIESIQITDIVWQLEHGFDIPEIPLSFFFRLNTIGDIVDYIGKRLESIDCEDDSFDEHSDLDDEHADLIGRALGRFREGGHFGDGENTKFDICLASDHAGIHLRGSLADSLRARNYFVADLGPSVSISVDYPEYAERVCQMVASGKAMFGVLICGSGVGMAIAANRHKGIRAVVGSDPVTVTLARKHNDANILCIGARVVGEIMAEGCLSAFLTTSFTPGDDGRHQRRINKIDASSQDNSNP